MISDKFMKTNHQKILDVGCGLVPIEGAIGIDINCGDIRHDLNSFPYPIPDNSFDEIYSCHCIEHLDDFQRVIEELYRIVKPCGIIEIIVPFFSSHCAHHPFHKKFFNYGTFEQFTDTEDKRWTLDSKAKFKIESIRYQFYPRTKNEPKIYQLTFCIPELLANIFPRLYQRIFAYILPAFEIRFLLKPLKSEIG